MSIFLFLQAAGVPVDFEPFFFSEVNPTLSATLEQVTNSINKNGICLKVILVQKLSLNHPSIENIKLTLFNNLILVFLGCFGIT